MTEPLDFNPPADGHDLYQVRRRLGVSIGVADIPDPAYGPKIGPQIYAVEPGGRADLAGLQQGDIILECDGKPVDSLPGAGKDMVTATVNYFRNLADQDILLVIKRLNQKTPIKLILPNVEI